MARLLIALSIATLFMSEAAHAAPAFDSCPATITVNQQLAKPVTGWKAGEDNMPHRLASVTFFDGPPEENASLVYDKLTRTAGKQIGTWRFGKNNKRTQWLSCGYAGTSITLSKSLPAGITSCSVTYDLGRQVSGRWLIERIDCK
jgi:hypothetical protein